MSHSELHPVESHQSISLSEDSEATVSSDQPSVEKGSSGLGRDSEQKRPVDKVRLYDLAREMGRDNKDLLDACDQLGIPYKSHSSTISAKQAEQIRTNLSSSSSKSRLPRPVKSNSPRPVQIKAEKPQQILNVRPPERRESASESHTPPVASPKPVQAPVKPQRPVREEVTSPVRQVHPPVEPPSSLPITPEAGVLTGPPKRSDSPSGEKPIGQKMSEEPSTSLGEEAKPKSSTSSLGEKTKSKSLLSVDKPYKPEEGQSSGSKSKNQPSEKSVEPKQPPLRTPTSPIKPEPPTVLNRPSPPQPPPQMGPPNPPPQSPSPPPSKEVVRPSPPARKTIGSPRPSVPVKNESPAGSTTTTGSTTTPPRVRPSKAKEGAVSQDSTRSQDSARSQDSTRSQQAPKPQLVSAPKPQAPVKPQLTSAPKPVKPQLTSTTKPQIASPIRPQLVGAPVRPSSRAPETPEGLLTKRSLDISLKAKPELVGPPTRQVAKLDKDGIASPDAPSRTGPRLRRREDEEEDEELQALKKPAVRTQTKRKRARRQEDTDVDTLESEVITTAGGIKTLDPGVFKPLPRPTAKPPSTGTPPTAAVRPKSAPSVKPKHSRQPSQSNEAADPIAQEERPKILILDGNLTVQAMAGQMGIPETDIIRTLFMRGIMVSINQVLDVPTAETVATELGYTIGRKEVESKAKKSEMLDLEDIDHLMLRSPVVTIMGHVDHGKTTLLDAIRNSKVVEGEAGGITQRIGAYHVDVNQDSEHKRVVFLDTPGHEAFTAMRARGARVTDIAILVVAADDGVQPQTLEALSHARAAGVPIVVAVNKIDKPDSQPERIKQQLAEHGLVSEEWGGDTPMVEVSALTRLNLDSLLEMILLVAEIAELQANPNRPARGTVIESHLDKSRGPVATLLVQNGTLRVGDSLVAGSIFGRVKAMTDDRGQRLQEAGPSSAVQLLGLNDVPVAGDEFLVYADEREARQIADERAESQRQSRIQQTLLSRRVSLGTVSAQAQEGKLKELNLIIKTDVQGSAEAILGSLQQLSQEEVQVRVLLAAPGEIVETDVDLAAASNAIIIGFTTNVSSHVRQVADRYGVDIREYDVIYNLLEDITGAMEGLLDPEQVEEALGQAEVRQVITIGKGAIAGSYVQSGKIMRNAFLRVRRKGNLIYEGRLDSLRRFKDDVREVASGFECGVGVDRFNDWTEGDILEVYQMVMKRRTLSTSGR